MRKAAVKNLIVWAAAITVLALVWTIAYFSVDNPFLVPSFLECVKKIGEILISSYFWIALFSTLERVLFAFFFSVIFALIFAVIAYLVPTFKVFFSPIISVLRSMPVLGVLLMLIVWAGAGGAPIWVAFLSLFPMLYTGYLAAIDGVDPALLEMSKAYKVPLKTRLLKLYLPTAAPTALKETGASLAFAVKLVVSAEVLAMTYQSLGGWLQEAKAYLDIPLLFAIITVTVALGLVLETLGIWLASIVERRVK